MANGVRKSWLVKVINKKVVEYTAQEVGQAWNWPVQLVLADHRYWGVPLWIWKYILQYTGVDAGQYQSEIYDCDDFSFALKGVVPRRLPLNGIGIVFDLSSQHAFNCILVVDDNDRPQFKFVEPQTDHLVITGESQYTMQGGFAIM